MSDSVFTRIIKGEIPCHKVYEDDKCLAFLDINPYADGHTLVIPKGQIDHLWDLEDELYQHLMKVVKKIAKRQLETLGSKRAGVIVEGFAVSHAHVHVFPMNKGIYARVDGNEIGKPTQEELTATAKRLAF